MPRYVALQRLLIDGEWREIGEEVPELESWPGWESYLRTQHVGIAEEPFAESVSTPQAQSEPAKVMIHKRKE